MPNSITRRLEKISTARPSLKAEAETNNYQNSIRCVIEKGNKQNYAGKSLGVTNEMELN